MWFLGICGCNHEPMENQTQPKPMIGLGFGFHEPRQMLLSLKLLVKGNTR